MSDDPVDRPQRKPRILFMAEAVTLAHVARPHVLANALSPDEYEVLFASDPRYDQLFADAKYARRAIHSIPSQQFLQALGKGAPVYDIETLEAYVQEDLAVIDDFRPDAIVGDFRLSLSVMVRLRQVPYLGITNAYWSPHASVRFLVPELPMTRLLGYTLGQLAFDLGRPLGFAMHARPMNRLRKKHGLASFGLDVRRVYTDADRALFADWPEFVPLRKCAENQHFIGPILWSPRIESPDWWDRLDSERPIVYVTLGSSGDASLLPTVLAGLAELPITVIAATAGRLQDLKVPQNAFVADYLPGDEATNRASLVISNGGSPTTYQALWSGKPVIGIPSNLDQCLNMANLSRLELGSILRIGNVTESRVREAVKKILESPPGRPENRRLCASEWNQQYFRELIADSVTNIRRSGGA